MSKASDRQLAATRALIAKGKPFVLLHTASRQETALLIGARLTSRQLRCRMRGDGCEPPGAVRRVSPRARFALPTEPAPGDDQALRGALPAPMEFYTWATDEELAVWPEPPTNVRLVTKDGQELPVDLVYLGKQDRDLAEFTPAQTSGCPPRTGVVALDVWETAPPCSRQDLCGMRVTYMPPLCLIKVDRGNA
jgi:hypothetical protein